MTEKFKNWFYLALMMASLWETETKYEIFFTLNVKYKILFLQWKSYVKILTTPDVIQENVLEGDRWGG